MKGFVKEHLVPIIMLILGAACAAFSIECFLITNTILDGGVTGISMMLNFVSELPLSILIVVINIPFFVVGFRALGKRFLLRSLISMASFAMFLEVFRDVDTVTSSELLAVVFGGVLLGVGVGTVLRNGGCLDGTEIAAMLLSRRTSVSTGGIIFFINIFIKFDYFINKRKLMILKLLSDVLLHNFRILTDKFKIQHIKFTSSSPKLRYITSSTRYFLRKMPVILNLSPYYHTTKPENIQY